MRSPEQLKGWARNVAAEKHLRAQEILQMFMFERLLERLAASPYQKNFILKGGLLISSMVGLEGRTTMDMDTTVRGIHMEEEEIVSALKTILAVDVGDGIRFEYRSIAPIREIDAYNNFRAHIDVLYGKINTPMKIDITTGDKITPAAVQYEFPCFDSEKKIPIMAYTIETILAEKYETIIRRGATTTRARDFYDLYTLYRTRKSEIRPQVLKDAVLHTAEKRESLEDLADWKEILDDLRDDSSMQQLWDSYGMSNSYAAAITFGQTLETVKEISELIESLLLNILLKRSHLWALFYWRNSMDIETLLRKAEQNGCMVVLNDIAPNRERSELVFRVPESVYDTPVAALDIDESTKNALQKQKITVLENLLHRLAMGKNAAKQLHIAQDAAEQVVNAVIETAYRSLSEPEKRNFWERILHNTDGDAM